MKIELSSIFKEVGKRIDVNLEEKISFTSDDITLTKPVIAVGKVINTGKSVLLTAKISTELELTCGRCLKQYHKPLEFDVEEQYCRSRREYSELTGEYELSDEDFYHLIEDDNSIDLYEVIRQNLLANMPMKTLCKEGCHGIETKKSDDDNIDPRLAKLKDFLNK